MRGLSLGEAARAIYALRFGPQGEAAYHGALLLAAVALGMRPELPQIVTSEETQETPFTW